MNLWVNINGGERHYETPKEHSAMQKKIQSKCVSTWKFVTVDKISHFQSIEKTTTLDSQEGLSAPERGGGGYSPTWWGCAARFSKRWPYFRPKYIIFHTPFQTWPRKSVPHFRPSFNITTRFPGTGFHLHNAPLEAVWMSLVNVKVTRETNEHVPCQNHTLFQTKQLENHTLKCGTDPYCLYIGVPPHPPSWAHVLFSCSYDNKINIRELPFRNNIETSKPFRRHFGMVSK